jgi:hypothetical protein
VQRLIAEGFAERQKEREQLRKIFNEKYNKAGKGKSVRRETSRSMSLLGALKFRNRAIHGMSLQRDSVGGVFQTQKTGGES